MKSFLLVFDRKAGVLLREEEVGDRRGALRKRFDAERAHKSEPWIEVVVLNADSAQALRRTHTRYFESAGQMVRTA